MAKRCRLAPKTCRFLRETANRPAGFSAGRTSPLRVSACADILGGSTAYERIRSGPGGRWPEQDFGERKVRAPQDRVVGNSHRPKGPGKCNRKQTASRLAQRQP